MALAIPDSGYRKILTTFWVGIPSIHVIRFILATLISIAVYPLAAQTKPQPVEVAVFLGCECPISQKYIARLNELYLQYNDESQLRWRFVVPEKIKNRDLQDFIREYQVLFPLERETNRKSMVKKFQADVTPQVVILDGETILYSGAVDNWFYGLGQYRQVTTENYLKDALEAVLAGKKPPIEKTEAIGCPIARR